MNEIQTLPVLPLREAVILPGVTMPIVAGRPGTLRAVDAALASPERMIFAVTQRQPGSEVEADKLYTIGTVARITQVQRGLAGVQLLIQGERRGIAVRYAQENGHLVATIKPAEEMPPLDPRDPAFVGLLREARERASELGKRAGLPEDVVEQVIAAVEDAGRLADLVAAYTEMTPAERQALLETLSVEERLRRVLIHVQRQLSVLEAQEDIQSKVREELGDKQREFYLRQQLKAIQDELGEGEGPDDLKELKAKLDALPLTDAVRKEVNREYGRAARIGRESMEAQVIRTFLETVAELPWGKRSEDKLDLEVAQRVLDEDHYGLKDVKDRVLEFLAVRKLREEREKSAPDAAAQPAEVVSETGEAKPAPKGFSDEKATKGPILLFGGPPGVGKTSVAKSIARAMGREYVRISLGGARDEADIRGHRRTYVGAMPGRIIQGMKQAGTKNPVFLLDEVDKLGVSFQGDPASALLEVLDPAQNDSFVDHYLGVPFDLSEVLFIATGNFIEQIPAPLLDRMELVSFSGYTEREKMEIARQYLVPRQLEENGLGPEQLQLDEAALSEVVGSYTREAGVRQLERELGKLARKVARQIAAGKTPEVEVTPDDVRVHLGRPRVHPERAAQTDQVGVATGMFYTPVGGDILFVEVSTMPSGGKPELELTGQLGDVMKESARAAWTYARSHAKDLGIEESAFQRNVHVHVPAGAVPKDGPSAGVTMSTALVSALSGRAARHDMAMTGEITLTGRVLPIGGLKEKILGGVRAGITNFVIPRENEADLDELPEEVRQKIQVHPVAELGEVLALALRGASYREGKLLFAEGETGHVQGAGLRH